MEESLDIGIQHASLENENENSEIHQEANTSSVNETQIEGLVKDITRVFASSQPPFSITGRINVPDHLRKVDEEAYIPWIISIGPIHHSDAKLQRMEKCKVRYLECFITRANVNLKNLVSAVTEMENEIRCCYAETIVSSMSSDDFVKMILMDAIFILELLFRWTGCRPEEDDPMMAEPWLISFVLIDLMLLENQLPFFVLKKLFDLSFSGDSNSFSLLKLSIELFHPFYFSFIKLSQPYSIEHFPSEYEYVNLEILHLTDLIRTFFLSSPLPGRESKVSKLLYTATQLQEAGVKFKVSSETSVLAIKFDSKKGVLEIPYLVIIETTVILVRNLIALEQSRYLNEAYITDYFVLLNFLIKTTKDMDLLCEKGILVNYLSDSNKATTALQDLNYYLLWSCMNSDCVKICEDLNEFYKKSWHIWKAILRNQYFSSPWRTASTIAAIILLVLTLIQTVCSIIQVKPK